MRHPKLNKSWTMTFYPQCPSDIQLLDKNIGLWNNKNCCVQCVQDFVIFEIDSFDLQIDLKKLT